MKTIRMAMPYGATAAKFLSQLPWRARKSRHWPMRWRGFQASGRDRLAAPFFT
jgi:hypothetical protein